MDNKTLEKQLLSLREGIDSVAKDIYENSPADAGTPDASTPEYNQLYALNGMSYHLDQILSQLVEDSKYKKPLGTNVVIPRQVLEWLDCNRGTFSREAFIVKCLLEMVQMKWKEDTRKEDTCVDGVD